jgi:hypothetical protein
MIRAIGYIRVSTDEQAKEGMSLENQEQKIRDYCKVKLPAASRGASLAQLEFKLRRPLL